MNKVNHTLKVGDILYSSWGYDQTNISWYQVTQLVGKQSVKIRKIHGKIDSYDMSTVGVDNVIGVKDSFFEPTSEWDTRGKEQLKRVTERNGIKLSNYEWAQPWDGEPQQETSLGYGH